MSNSRLEKHTVSCKHCGDPIVWAMTVAGPNGPGGRWLALNPEPDEDGNVATWSPRPERVLARVLAAGERPVAPLEHRAMPHKATCTPTPQPTDPGWLRDTVREVLDERAAAL